MTRVEGENAPLRHALARLHHKTLCYSKSQAMLKHSIRLLLHYLKFWDVPAPHGVIPLFSNADFDTAIPSIVNSKVAQGKKVHFADMSSLSVNGLTSSLALNLDNGLHPNAEGYRKIANFWYRAVLKILPQQASSISPYYQLPRTLKYDA